MFDANMVLIDGTSTLTTGTHTPSTSASSRSNGAIVIDIRETGASGLVAVLILSELGGAADSYTLTGFIEVSDNENFGSIISEVGKFDILAASKGVILGIETPDIVLLRFATGRRYVRANLTVSNDFGGVKVYLTPFPFKTL